MLRIPELRIPVERDETLLKEKIIIHLKINKEELIEYKIIKRSVDARKKAQIFYSYVIDVKVKHEKKVLRNKRLRITKVVKREYNLPQYKLSPEVKRPIIVGFGPSGMFASLILSLMGLKPIVFERGEAVEQRIKDVDDFWKKRSLHVNSNIQFGEGGAGTFSDGKLTTRVKDVRSDFILKEFVSAGANEDILYVNNPHIGTDVLVQVVKKIRGKILSLGGEIHFNSVVDDLSIENNKITAVHVNSKKYLADDVILAIGHSARDTFTMLYNKGVTMQQKAFAVGVRIEHPQKVINEAQYGGKYLNFPKLNAAEYKLTHRASNGKSIYTFCMCPGGMVVPSSSELETVVVNGMSEYLRNRENANSALVCTVNSTDFNSTDPLAGMHYQRDLEQKAFILGGKNYAAPIQLVKDFLKNEVSTKLGTVQPSYPIDYKLTDLNPLFSKEIADALKEAIPKMEQKLHNFALDDAILTGVETRTSSPVRIMRNESLESKNVNGLYPCGEGAGYAGGIMSAAIDGIKIAEMICEKHKL